MNECVAVFTHILKNFAIRVFKTFTHHLSNTSRYSHASTWSVFSFFFFLLFNYGSWSLSRKRDQIGQEVEKI